MERMGLLKKRMVYPVQLELNRMSSDKPSIGSWCDGDHSLLCSPNNSSERLLSDGPRVADPDPLTGLEELEKLYEKVPRLTKDSEEERSNYRGICESGSNAYILHSNGQLFIQERMQHLVRAFTERAQRIRRRLDFPPTPSTASSEQGDNCNCANATQVGISTAIQDDTVWSNTDDQPRSLWWRFKNIDWNKTIDPQSIKLKPIFSPEISTLIFLLSLSIGYTYIYWLLSVTLCFTYNCCVIPLRSTFPYQNTKNTVIWLICDYVADLFYLVDIVVVRPRVMFLEDGFWVKDPRLTRKNYMRKWQFKMDILSLLPLDVLYFAYGYCQALLRIPRFLKIQTFWELYNCMDSVLSNPHVVRIARTLSYMLYLIHINACAYYAFSAWEGLGSNGWVFNGVGNAYIRCFYFATKTATSIGKNPKPENEYEYMFMTASWLMGVFVFALLIGQIRDIITTATYSRTEYRKLVDETLEYMRRLNLPRELQERVKLWFTFTWEQQHTLVSTNTSVLLQDEGRILDSLPIKMKTDVAINVHIQTLSKVQLFHDCDEALLRELVLKLRPVIYLPGDTICRKGEVGKEMYIVKTGQVQVIGGPTGDEVLATLTEGSVFGEISLLALNGGNRRTADVRSHGFSNLFVLSKSDLNEAILHYPDAQEILKKKARSLMRKNAARERPLTDCESEVIKLAKDPPLEMPRLIKTVLQVVSEESMTARLLKYGSQRRMQRYGDKKREAGAVGSSLFIPAYLQVVSASDELARKSTAKPTRAPRIMPITRSNAIATCLKKNVNVNNNTSLFCHERRVKKTTSEPCLGLRDVNTFQCMVVVHREMH
ncbi:cyclic nucleotide-gated channel beta-3 isoform X2 [Neodiprion pinetum]|uniref:cyclic nucleotide-gated channel beta-3 isoform X2 n=1 Tax=Neodiprion pinetum TaxID=441929 RepID=UPI001EDE7A3A|nr:cyclic nucleotide-gated cation channel beta-3 isoform X2 [Neodiprion pinetum]